MQALAFDWVALGGQLLLELVGVLNYLAESPDTR